MIVVTAAAIILHNRKPGENEADEIYNLNASLVNSEVPELEAMDRRFEKFLRQWGIHGASLAITRNDSLVYVKGYGESDSLEAIRPGTLFRLASVSKLLTATGIMLLEERDSLSLDNRIFGPDGILEDENYASFISDKRYYDITVNDLLRHTSGLSSRGGDPLFPGKDFLLRHRWTHAPDRDSLLRAILKSRLRRSPGTQAEYSNLGYLLASLVIEKITGEPYEQWMQANVLKPCGCIDFHIARNYETERLPGETKYYCHSQDTLCPKIDGSGELVPRCYGGSDVTALSGAGAWVASSAELARFVCCIDRLPEIPDLLEESGVCRMTLPTDVGTFGLGWNDITENGEWTRTGTLSSTSALIKVYPDGECWIMVTNTGTWKGARFTRYIASLFKRSREDFSSLLPSVNLFERPPVNENPSLDKR